jgi:hypothetical protein
MLAAATRWRAVPELVDFLDAFRASINIVMRI